MNKLLALALSVAFAAPSFAGTKAEVERKVSIISKIAHGHETHVVKAKNGYEMVLALYMKNSGENRKEALKSFIKNANADKLAFSDETTWGTLDTEGAQTVYGWLDSDGNGDEARRVSEKQQHLAQQIIKELGRSDGVSFGYTSNSSGYCGVGFMGLLVVDEENDTIYEIALTDSGSC